MEKKRNLVRNGQQNCDYYSKKSQGKKEEEEENKEIKIFGLLDLIGMLISARWIFQNIQPVNENAQLIDLSSWISKKKNSFIYLAEFNNTKFSYRRFIK